MKKILDTFYFVAVVLMLLLSAYQYADFDTAAKIENSFQNGDLIQSPVMNIDAETSTYSKKNTVIFAEDFAK